MPSTVAWLCEEVGELAQAVRKGTRDQQLHELGDVIAWVASLAHQLGLSLDEAAQRYGAERTPLVVIGGKEYGTGSSRDWAAKGTRLLGIGAIVAESFERIHRSNLVGMGVLPLQFPEGQSAASLGLTGEETFSVSGVTGLNDGGIPATMKVTTDTGVEIDAVVRIDTPGEADYYRNGGILHFVLRQFLRGEA